MKEFTPFFIIIVLISIFYLYLENKEQFLTSVETKSSPKRKFLVRVMQESEKQQGAEDESKAAELLNEITNRLQKIVDHVYENIDDMVAKYTDSTYQSEEKFRSSIKRMKSNFKPENISESSPGNKYTSYSINKGEKLVFCLRAKKGVPKLTDINTMMFVAIHELAHLQSKSIGHNKEFWDNMRFLLKIGIKLCVYCHTEYHRKHKAYCGIEITGTPLDMPPEHNCSECKRHIR